MPEMVRSKESDWSSFYEKLADPTLLSMFSSFVYQKPYLRNICERKPHSVLEIGIGRALHSIILSYFVPEVVGIDNQNQLVKKALSLNQKFRGNARFLIMDAKNLGFEDQSFSVCCHQGFFEHFDDHDIQELIKEQLRVARLVVFSVPSCYYSVRNKGDERLLSIQQWGKILNGYSIKGFYYGLDVDLSKGFLGNLTFRTLKKVLSGQRAYKTQICIIVEKP